jgi:hypothetical protein
MRLAKIGARDFAKENLILSGECSGQSQKFEDEKLQHLLGENSNGKESCCATPVQYSYRQALKFKKSKKLICTYNKLKNSHRHEWKYGRIIAQRKLSVNRFIH